MKISVITPSLNQGKFIERTIQSVLNQKGDYEIEYIVIDGGSKDSTINILKNYQNRLKWVSEKDQGQADAINKGFSMASGDLFAWLNSDDTYEKNALNEVTQAYIKHNFKWCFGNCRNISENDGEIRRFITRYKLFESRRYSYKRLLSKDFISQPSVFFTREAYEEIGPMDIKCKYSMDYDYWLRIGKKYKPYYINKYLSNFRWHSGSKNSRNYREAAHETYLVAKKQAMPRYRYSIIRHYIHYRALILLYRFL